MSRAPLRFALAGTGALLLDCAEGPFDLGTQRLVWSVAEAARGLEAVLDVVPGMNNLMVAFDPVRLGAAEVEAVLRRLWRTVEPSHQSGREWVVPVAYGGPEGEDLPMLARHAGLSIDGYVARHAASTYTVAAIGSMAGYPYLAGLDSALACPRRTTPRLKVAAGAVIVGGAQAGIMPCEAPSGWHILGHADFPLFDATKTPPTRLALGDTIRFMIGSVQS